MAIPLWIRARWFALAVALGMLVGCGKDHQSEALGDLYEEDYAFTVDDFLRAAKEGRADAVRWYLRAGMDPDVENQAGERALGLAAERAHRAVAVLLLEDGASADIEGPGGRTPLLGAAEAGEALVVRELLARGVDFLHRDLEGWTALRLASFYGHDKVVGELLAADSTEGLDSALLLASLGGHVGVMDQLLAAGADVYRRTPEGQTALMQVAMRGHVGAARLLLDRGANRFATDTEGRTAAGLAGEVGETALADELGRAPTTDLAGAPLPALSDAEYEIPGSVWRLDGAQLEGELGERDAVRLTGYCEQQLPVTLEKVEADRKAAAIRMLYDDRRTVWVSVGEQVPDLPFVIVTVNHQPGFAKGTGQARILQSATVRDLRTGREFLMTPEDPGLSTFTYIDLVDARGRLFRGRRGDRFELRSGDELLPFRILDLRPREVLIERTDTGQVVTLHKDGGIDGV